MTKVELSEVLRAHVWLNPKMWGFGVNQCEGCAWKASTSMPAVGEHTDHLADVMLAWVAAQARGFAVQRFDERGPMDARGAALWDFAVWATEDARNRPGATAGVEMAPVATEDLAGPQIAGMRSEMTDPYGKDFR